MSVSITKFVILLTFTLFLVFGSSQAKRNYAISDEAFYGFKESILENIKQEELTCRNYVSYCTQANIPQRSRELCLETYEGFLCGRFYSDADIKEVMQKFLDP